MHTLSLSLKHFSELHADAIAAAAVDEDLHHQCDQKKSPNVYKSCPKMISLEKWKILTSLQKLPKNVGNLGKLIVATGFKKLPKAQ